MGPWVGLAVELAASVERERAREEGCLDPEPEPVRRLEDAEARGREDGEGRRGRGRGSAGLLTGGEAQEPVCLTRPPPGDADVVQPLKFLLQRQRSQYIKITAWGFWLPSKGSGYKSLNRNHLSIHSLLLSPHEALDPRDPSLSKKARAESEEPFSPQRHCRRVPACSLRREG